MNAHTEVQLINGPDGSPAFAVIPYQEYLARFHNEPTIPHAVVSAIVDGATPARAWREFLELTQAEVAARMGVSQSAYAQTEAAVRPRKATLVKLAAALGLKVEQLQ